MRHFAFLTATHIAAILIGFVIGIYTLPILTAPAAPDAEILVKKSENALFTAKFTKDLRGSDFLHWGKGKISLTENEIIFKGTLAPGPDYKLYLLKEFVEHEDGFSPLKNSAQLIGDIKSFDGFIVEIPETIDVKDYNTVIIWCEAFSEFITSAQYQDL